MARLRSLTSICVSNRPRIIETSSEFSVRAPGPVSGRVRGPRPGLPFAVAPPKSRTDPSVVLRLPQAAGPVGDGATDGLREVLLDQVQTAPYVGRLVVRQVLRQ